MDYSLNSRAGSNILVPSARNVLPVISMLRLPPQPPELGTQSPSDETYCLRLDSRLGEEKEGASTLLLRVGMCQWFIQKLSCQCQI